MRDKDRKQFSEVDMLEMGNHLFHIQSLEESGDAKKKNPKHSIFFKQMFKFHMQKGNLKVVFEISH